MGYAGEDEAVNRRQLWKQGGILSIDSFQSLKFYHPHFFLHLICLYGLVMLFFCNRCCNSWLRCIAMNKKSYLIFPLLDLVELVHAGILSNCMYWICLYFHYAKIYYSGPLFYLRQQYILIYYYCDKLFPFSSLIWCY